LPRRERRIRSSVCPGALFLALALMSSKSAM
jgi:hypothetical protein